MARILGVFVILAVATTAMGQRLWDNEIVTNGSAARAISPPAFPNIRVADDFVVPEGKVWNITDILYHGIEDANWVWNDGDEITVTVYADAGGKPGAIVEQRAGVGSREDFNETFFGRKAFRYDSEWRDNLIVLQPGTYWMGIRHPTGGGAGTNYWLTSDGGADGASSSTGYFSLDSGNTWEPEGDIWHHAFIIEGFETPEPASLVLLALGGLAVLRRRS